jgi:molecular chaperone IbpA
MLTKFRLSGRHKGSGDWQAPPVSGRRSSQIAHEGGFDMRSFDLTPYRRSMVGFDRLFDLLENSARSTAPNENYPPFDLERLAEDRYRITLAVAGFRKDEIDITAQQNLLLVTGKKETAAQDRANFLHVGIANRSFERRFELADFVRVQSADLADGLLTIELVREVPETMKPQKIAIGANAQPTAVNDGRTIEHEAA